MVDLQTRVIRVLGHDLIDPIAALTSPIEEAPYLPWTIWGVAGKYNGKMVVIGVKLCVGRTAGRLGLLKRLDR